MPGFTATLFKCDYLTLLPVSLLIFLADPSG